MVLSLKNTRVHNVIEFIKQRKILILYGVIFLLGLLFGAVFSGKQSFDVLNLKIFFENYLASRRNSQFVDIFKNTFLSGFLYLLLCYFSGVFVLGSISNGVVLLLKGSSVGLLMGYSYSIYGLKGVAFAIIIILPGAFITALALIYSARESCLFSLYFLRLFTNNPVLRSLVPELKKYCIKFIIYLVFIILSALVDGVSTRIFWNVFNL